MKDSLPDLETAYDVEGKYSDHGTAVKGILSQSLCTAISDYWSLFARENRAQDFYKCWTLDLTEMIYLQNVL